MSSSLMVGIVLMTCLFYVLTRRYGDILSQLRVNDNHGQNQPSSEAGWLVLSMVILSSPTSKTGGKAGDGAPPHLQLYRLFCSFYALESELLARLIIYCPAVVS